MQVEEDPCDLVCDVAGTIGHDHLDHVAATLRPGTPRDRGTRDTGQEPAALQPGKQRRNVARSPHHAVACLECCIAHSRHAVGRCQSGNMRDDMARFRDRRRDGSPSCHRAVTLAAMPGVAWPSRGLGMALAGSAGKGA
ncbi:hypothetical protein Rmf_07960 [Roseomonas fluvialis]|uniref:Uncharacterized protein n=1 Tax=Roseomonas fluvialis TaxID=1750527 RepID=A0ABM7XZC9_9PROT|nr:hypothetical protein Rmf_07960 [Roseomonas fluvialis]